jgi:hypothetical protein
MYAVYVQVRSLYGLMLLLYLAVLQAIGAVFEHMQLVMMTL